MAKWIADALSETLQAKVEIGNVNLGFLTRIIIDDVTLNDRQGVRMLKVSRLSTSINYLELLQGNIVLPTAQLFSPTAILYRDSLGAEPNYQFLIDTFSSDNDEEKTPLNLRINSFILRHANISYDIKNLPHADSIQADSKGKPIYAFDPHHIFLKDAGMNVSIKALTNDSLNLTVKRLSAKEANSRLSVEELNLALEANKQHAQLSDFYIKSAHSTATIETLCIYYPEYETNGTFSLDTTTLKATLTPADFKSLLPAVKSVYSPLHLEATLSGNNHEIDLNQLHVQNTLGNIRLHANATAALHDNKVKRASAHIRDLHATADALHQLFSELQINEEPLKPLLQLGTIDYTGSIDYTPAETHSEGKILTQAGNIDYTASIDSEQTITGHIISSELQLGTIFDNENYGTATIDLDASGTVRELRSAIGRIGIQSPALDVMSEVDFHSHHGQHNLQLDIDADRFNPHALALTSKFQGEEYQFYLQTQLTGSNIDDLTGYARLYDVRMQSDSTLIDLNAIELNIEQTDDAETHYNIESDFFTLDILGKVKPSRLPDAVISMLHTHLPSIIHPKKLPTIPTDDIQFSYSAWMIDAPFLHHFLGGDYHIDAPISISGSMDARQQEMNLWLETRQIEYAGNKYHNIIIDCKNTSEQLTAKVSGLTVGEESAAKLNATAQATNDTIGSNIQLQIRGNTDINLDLNSFLTFSDSLNHLKTSIDVGRSSLSINDTIWQMSPAHMSLCNKEIACNGLHISKGDSYLHIDGTASPNPNDSIVVQLNDLQIEYILDAVNFSSIDFGGWASGKIVIDDVMSDSPLLAARLQVKNLTFETGLMGNADIAANWDKEQKAIILDANIIKAAAFANAAGQAEQSEQSGGLTFPGQTIVHGHISPANDDILLEITARETPAEFLNGFLDGVFNPITGTITGQVNVVGPLSKVNLEGEVDATLNLSLLATDVPYQLDKQHITLKRGLMQFQNITLTDRFGNRGIVNGNISHQYLSNFQYQFNINFNRLLAYEERNFNADKFLATIFANGNLNIRGRDGHPMYLTANITPTRGSVFAYDAASPDAIVSGKFIEFRDITPKDTVREEKIDYLKFNYSETEDNIFGHFELDRPLHNKKEIAQEDTYEGDLYMDFNVNLNEDCEIKLRMDHTADGYINTRGNGALTAKYYNKGTLELFGTYNINQGSYRLYLQDIIYRDLAMQPGSSVEFNGPPFDANIHLICHHLINSVPLIDLTATAALAQNNKVRVNCILDITGNLGNMAFNFDFDILNTNDEVKQLVRSMINSEEEMNTQMIYLLALGRFYPTNMARADNDDTSSSAVNSLVSSTISGQINNIISGLIGQNSNWNFGTGISTGEKGWEDLDVEGTLSGRLFNDRLLINGNFGYRDNALTNQGSFIGDVEVKWRLKQEGGNMYLKAYNQTNDRYFTKATLNTQGIGLSYMHDFDSWRTLFQKRSKRPATPPVVITDSTTIYVDSVR